MPRVMMIGAHPDDCDGHLGGTAAQWVDAGFEVMFVSATNGDAGHQAEGGGMLAQRRAAEAADAGALLGIPYRLLDNHDGELVPSLEVRKQFIRLIREYSPDLLITHRPWDYHPDHRYTGLLVQDASFLLTVPNICPLVPAMRSMPVIMYAYDGFMKPIPLEPDVIVDTDAVLDRKAALFGAHVSQAFEWLPWHGGGSAPEGEAERRAMMLDWMRRRGARCAERFRQRLIEVYGPERGAAIETAEAFEVCEYGASLTAERRRALFPFVPTDG